MESATTDEKVTIKDLEPITAAEIVNGSYESLKAVVSTYLAQVLATDALNARRLAQHVSDEIDNARVSFILEMRRLDDAGEVVGEVVEDDDSDTTE